MIRVFDVVTEVVMSVSVVLAGALGFIWLYENVLRYIA